MNSSHSKIALYVFLVFSIFLLISTSNDSAQENKLENSLSSGTGLPDTDWDPLYKGPRTSPEGVFLDPYGIPFYRGRIECVPEAGVRIEHFANAKEQLIARIREKNGAASCKRNFDYDTEEILWQDGPLKITYDCRSIQEDFALVNLNIMGDLSGYGYITFALKGQNRKKPMNIAIQSIVDKSPVSMFPIRYFLLDGVQSNWQFVNIPVSAFPNCDIRKTLGLVFLFPRGGEGCVWLDCFRFYKKKPYYPTFESMVKKEFLLLDDFEFNKYTNVLNSTAGCSMQLPSQCKHSIDADIHFGESGKSLKIEYDKRDKGWCLYTTSLNSPDGTFFNLSPWGSVSFQVRGEKGGEDFEIGFADANWQAVGDSMKAGSVKNYLRNGVTTDWQEVVIPFADFGLLDWTRMGSFVINFYKVQKGTIWIDNIKFYLKAEEESEEGF